MIAAKRQIRLMGTVIDTWIYHDQPEPILEEAEGLLYQYEKRFSANRPDSELMQINKKAGLEPVSVHPDLYELIKLGQVHSCATNSHLNISIGPLVQLWRIGFSDAKLPTPQEIEARRQLIDPRQIILNDKAQSVFLQREGMLIDLGALAKGYIADKIMAYLRSEGVPSALINLGGNVLTMGLAPHNPDGYWRIGIQNPLEKRGVNSQVLPIRDQSVVTSGIYERKLSVAGQTYHHILSSETGYPVDSDVASLTIISDQSVDGEIWTTRLFGHNLATITAELAQQPQLAGLAIMTSGQTYWLGGGDKDEKVILKGSS